MAKVLRPEDPDIALNMAEADLTHIAWLHTPTDDSSDEQGWKCAECGKEWPCLTRKITQHAR